MKYLFLFILFAGCKNADDKMVLSAETSSDYSFDKPIQVYVMPAELNEISGICFQSDKELLCEEDEHGKIYIYDVALKQVTVKLDFGPAGDYEDIARYKGRIYIVRSDGALFSFSGKETTELETGIPKGEDIEGLAADPANNRLLLAGKHKGKIYAYEPGTGALKELWKIDEKKFAPSALAIHPLSNDIYVISSVNKQLLVLAEDGKIKESYELTSKQFKQPEGMAFAANGDLYISNEGRGGDGNILLFRYQKK
jgi:DNA-binding beta-propeller fold protein YncE